MATTRARSRRSSSAATGLLLSCAGLHGVVSSDANARLREFGIRAGLGATSTDIHTLVARRAVGMVLPGLVAGVMLGRMLVRLLRSTIAGVGDLDALVTSAVVVVFVAVTALAATLASRPAVAAGTRLTIHEG